MVSQFYPPLEQQKEFRGGNFKTTREYEKE